MDYHDYSYKELEHLRFLDLSLLTLWAALVYLTVANWNPAPELARELQELKLNTKKLVSENLTAIELEDTIDDELVSARPLRASLAELKYSKQDSYNISFRVDIDNLSLKRLSRISSKPTNKTTMTIGEIRAYLLSAAWEVEQIEKIADGFQLSPECTLVIGEFQAKIAADKSNDSRSFFPARIKTRWLTLNLASIKILKWPLAQGKTGQAELSINIDLSEYWIGKDSEGTNHTSKSCSTVFSFESMRTSAQSGLSNWFGNRYKNIMSNWENLNNRTLPDAESWIEWLRVAGISGQQLSVFGIVIGKSGARHVFLFGLIISLAICLYMLIYSFRLRKYVLCSDYSQFLTPWMASMNLIHTRIISFVSMVLLPAVSCFLSLWRIFGLAPSYSLLICLGFGIPFYCVYSLAGKIAAKIDLRGP
jgi:hypothetical protein